MTKRIKSAFSLVEVMIIFTIVAVLMAASLPMITKKNSPVAGGAKHGVYTCIPTNELDKDGNKQYIQETYDVKRRQVIKSEAVTKCTFSPNQNASLFKVTLYSAGAGGRAYAAFDARNNDVANSQFRMQDLVNFVKSDENGTGSMQAYILGEEGTETAVTDVTFTQQDIVEAFGNNKYNHTVARSIKAGNGGNGQTVKFTFHSPAESYCAAYTNGLPNVYQHLKEGSEAIDPELYDELSRLLNEEENSSGILGRRKDMYTRIKNYAYDAYTSTSDKHGLAQLLFDEIQTASYDSAAYDTAYSVRISDSLTPIENFLKKYETYGLPETVDLVNDYKPVAAAARDIEYYASLIVDATDRTLNQLNEVSESEHKIEDILANLFSAEDVTATDKQARYKKVLDIMRAKILTTDPNTYRQYIRPLDLYASDGAPKLNIMYPTENSQLGFTNTYFDQYCIDNFREYYVNDSDVPDQWYVDPDGNSKQLHIYADPTDSSLNEFGVGMEGLYINTATARTAIQHGQPGGKGHYLVYEYYMSDQLSALPDKYKKDYYNPSGSTDCTSESLPKEGGIEPFNYLKYFSDMYDNTQRNKCGKVNPSGQNQGMGRMTCSDHDRDAIPSSKCTYVEIANDGISDVESGTPEKSFDEEVSTSATIFSGDTGKDVKDSVTNQYTAVHVPQFDSFLNVDNQIRTTQTASATGGMGGEIEIIKDHYISGVSGNIPVWKIKPRGGVTVQDSQADINTVATSDTQGKDAQYEADIEYRLENGTLVYKIYKSEYPIYREPRLLITSNLWTKKFYLGKPGTKGNQYDFQLPSLGTKCEFNVPFGGPVLIGAEGEGLAELKTEYEQNLSTTMTCYKIVDDEEKEFLSRSVAGGLYDLTLSETDEYKYHQAEEAKEIASAVEPEQPNLIDKITSKLSELVRTIVRGFDAGQHGLAGVGRAGSGTSLVDNCAVPKGYVKILSQEGYATTAEDIAKPSSFSGSVGIVVKNKQEPGTKGGEDCFGGSVGYHEIPSGSAYYDFSAGEGGPGAVIITW